MTSTLPFRASRAHGLRRRRWAAAVGVVALVLTSAGAAFADSPDPDPAGQIQGSVLINANGTRTLTVEGNWSWPTHKNDCNLDRYAAGYAVDWHDPSQPGTLISKNGISARVGTPTDTKTHWNTMANGNRCGTYSSALGYNTGHWGPISHTYPANQTTFSACVVTFDIHGSGTPKAADLEVATASDNSITSNGSTPAGNGCFLTTFAAPTITTNASASVPTGGQVTDIAHLAGGTSSIGGTITFKLYGPNDAACSTPAFTTTRTVSGNGDYTSAPYTPTTAGTYRWVASYGGDGRNAAVSGSCNDANESVVVTSPNTPLLSVLKTGPSTAVSGSQVDYTLTVSNTGTATAPAPLLVTDTLPAGETFVSATGASCTPAGQVVSCTLNSPLAAGASVPFTVRVAFAATASGDYTDCARIGTSQSCVTTTVTPTLSVTVDKTNNADGTLPFSDSEAASAVGSPVDFQVVVTNTSAVPVVIGSLTDVWPGLVAAKPICPSLVGTTLAAGASSAPCTFTEANYSPANGASKTNTVKVVVHEVNKTSNTAFDEDPSTVLTKLPNTPLLSVLKTGPSTAVSGSQVDYTITVSNTGTATAPAPLLVTDTLPAGETFVSATGASCSATAGPGQVVSCTLGAPLAAGASVPFTVRVAFAATATGAYTDCARIGTSQSCVTTTMSKPDLGIVKTGPATAVAGDRLTYTLTVTNTGVMATSGFTVTDTLPAGLTLVQLTPGAFTCMGPGISCTFGGTLAPGGSAAIGVTADLASSYALARVVNTAVVGPDDDTPGDNSSTVVTLLAPPDLSIVKSGPATASPGNTLTYTLRVKNIGGRQAENVRVTDPLAAGLTLVSVTGSGFTCTGSVVTCDYAGPLAPGSSVVLTVVALLAAPYGPSTVVNTATVGPTDGTPENNTSTWTTPVSRPISGTPVEQPVQGPTPPKPGPVAGTDEQPGAIPFTGSRADLGVRLGLLLVLAGVGLMMVARRRYRVE